MNRRPGTLAWTNLLRTAGLVLITACLVATTPARAGIGSPFKKLKEKITQKVDPTEPAAINNETVVFDDVVLELTDERLDRIVGAFKAAKAAGAGRKAVVEKLDQANEQRGKLWEKHGEKIMELQRKRDDINVCLRHGYNDAQERLTREYSQKALNDPAIREKLMRAAMEHNAAVARGDSSANQKLNATIMSETHINHEDSLAVQKKCGPVPPPTPPETEIAALDRNIAARNEELRAIDMKVADERSKEVGMKRDQFAIASERLQMYLAAKKSTPKQPPRGFTDAEIKAIEKRLEEIEASWDF